MKDKWKFDCFSFFNRLNEKHKGDWIILGVGITWASWYQKRIIFSLFGLEFSIWFKKELE